MEKRKVKNEMTFVALSSELHREIFDLTFKMRDAFNKQMCVHDNLKTQTIFLLRGVRCQ